MCVKYNYNVYVYIETLLIELYTSLLKHVIYDSKLMFFVNRHVIEKKKIKPQTRLSLSSFQLHC
jgi:hypothetical protein